VLRLLVRQVGRYQVLLPGGRGFDRRDHAVLNPSYYVFPALRVLAQAVPDPAWVRVAADGLALLRAARFGRWGLPPDWVSLARRDGAVSLPTNFAPRFSYDAVRVPLYLAWSRLSGEPALIGATGFWSDPAHSYLPAWTDLTNNAIAPYAASPGVIAIARLAAPQRTPTGIVPASFPTVASTPDYYSAALALLVHLAWREASTRSA
jgi:endoglucanase